jgi:hypothetical protein
MSFYRNATTKLAGAGVGTAVISVGSLDRAIWPRRQLLGGSD